MIDYGEAIFRNQLLDAKLPVPPTPELFYVWEWFTDLFNPGGVGMGPYRVEYQEIEAYSRVTGEIIHGWEAIVIRRLCETYIIVRSEVDKKPSTSSLPPGMKNVTTMNDTAGLKSLFLGQGTRKPKPGPVNLLSKEGRKAKPMTP